MRSVLALTSCLACAASSAPSPLQMVPADGGVAVPDAGVTGDDAGPAAGPQISCAPLSLEFGTAAANIGSTLPVICTNLGDTAWQIATLVTTSSVFSALVDPSSSFTVGPGASIQVDVSYLPTATETDTGTLTVTSTTGEVVVVALSGDAILEQPCYYSISPTDLSFSCNSSAPMGFTITNLGPNECLVTDLGSSCAGSLLSGAVTSQRLSAPGSGGAYPTQIEVTLTGACQQPDAGSCSFQFSINSDPTQTLDVTVPCCAPMTDGGGGS